MQTQQHVFVHKHISKIAIFLGLVPPSLVLYLRLFYTYHTMLAFISGLFTKHLKTYNVPGTVLGIGDAEKSKTSITLREHIYSLAPSNPMEMTVSY